MPILIKTDPDAEPTLQDLLLELGVLVAQACERHFNGVTFRKPILESLCNLSARQALLLSAVSLATVARSQLLSLMATNASGNGLVPLRTLMQSSDGCEILSKSVAIYEQLELVLLDMDKPL